MWLSTREFFVSCHDRLDGKCNLVLVAISTYCANSPQNRQCWDQYDLNTDYSHIVPDTGKTVEVSY